MFASVGSSPAEERNLCNLILYFCLCLILLLPCIEWAFASHCNVLPSFKSENASVAQSVECLCDESLSLGISRLNHSVFNLAEFLSVLSLIEVE